MTASTTGGSQDAKAIGIHASAIIFHMETQPTHIGSKGYMIHQGFISVALIVIGGPPKVYEGSPLRIARWGAMVEIAEHDRREVRRTTYIPYGHGGPHNQLSVGAPKDGP